MIIDIYPVLTVWQAFTNNISVLLSQNLIIGQIWKDSVSRRQSLSLKPILSYSEAYIISNS